MTKFQRVHFMSILGEYLIRQEIRWGWEREKERDREKLISKQFIDIFLKNSQNLKHICFLTFYLHITSNIK